MADVTITEGVNDFYVYLHSRGDTDEVFYVGNVLRKQD